jgi:hypothetical protein
MAIFICRSNSACHCRRNQSGAAALTFELELEMGIMSGTAMVISIILVFWRLAIGDWRLAIGDWR